MSVSSLSMLRMWRASATAGVERARSARAGSVDRTSVMVEFGVAGGYSTLITGAPVKSATGPLAVPPYMVGR